MRPLCEDGNRLVEVEEPLPSISTIIFLVPDIPVFVETNRVDCTCWVKNVPVNISFRIRPPIFLLSNLDGCSYPLLTI